MWQNTCFLTNRALRATKQGRAVYFFDEDGIYRKVSFEKAKELNIGDVYFWGKDNVRIFKWYQLVKPLCDVNGNLLVIAISKLKDGDTAETFFKYISEAKFERHELPKGLDRFITKIQGPYIEREFGNTSTNTFDFVYVDVCIIQNWETDRKSYIKANMPEIKRRVIQKIEGSKRFQRYGIPVNFLKITSITLTRDDMLHFIFELKEIK